MAGKMANHDINNLIARNKAGESVKSIAKSVGVHERTISDHFHAAGFRAINPLHKSIRLDIRAIHAEHDAGATIQALSRKHGISRKSLASAFASRGLAVRSMSGAAAMRHTIMSPDERLTNTAAAQSARRGQVDTIETLTKRAANMKHRIGLYEREIIQELHNRGITCDGQHAIGKYNVDIFLHEPLVAVEVYSYHPGTPRMAQIRERTEYILNSGLSQITVQVTYPSKIFHLATVCDKVVAYADFCRRTKPAIGHHAVIRGDGEIATRSSHQSNDRPLIASF